ncbi:unnamed protein product, partial [Prorocentrum cordatum]
PPPGARGTPADRHETRARLATRRPSSPPRPPVRRAPIGAPSPRTPTRAARPRSSGPSSTPTRGSRPRWPTCRRRPRRPCTRRRWPSRSWRACSWSPPRRGAGCSRRSTGRCWTPPAPGWRRGAEASRRGRGAAKRRRGDGERARPVEAGAGLTRSSNGMWRVQVGWRNFKVSAELECLHRALEIHTFLCDARNQAASRHARTLAELEAVGAPSRAVGGHELDDSPLLTAGELAAVLREDPLAPLLFSSDLGVKGGGRRQTAWTPCLGTALRFRLLTRQVQARGAEHGRLVALMADTAARERRGAQEAEVAARLAAAVEDERARRTKRSAPDDMSSVREGLRSLTREVLALASAPAPAPNPFGRRRALVLED